MSQPQEGDTLTLNVHQPHVTATCPCGGQFTAGECTNGEGMTVHSIPPCEKYLALDVIAFLQWARRNGARTLS
jgi:hypothetical protein